MFKSFMAKAAPKSVDSVMAAFNKSITDLDEVQSRELAAADTFNDEASAALTRANNASAEARRAASVAVKLRSLVAA